MIPQFSFITHLSSLSDAYLIFSEISEVKEMFLKSAQSKDLLRNEILLRISKSDININIGSGINDSVCCGTIKFLPYLPMDFVRDEGKEVLEYINRQLMEYNNMGVKIVGLGGFSSMLGDRGTHFSRNSNLAITSGNTLTASLIVHNLMQLFERYNLDIKKAKILVVGASGDIGFAVTKYLFQYFADFILAARDIKKLREMYAPFSHKGINALKFSNDIKSVIQDVNIIISVTSSPIPFIDLNDIQPGTFVVDASYPSNIMNFNPSELKGVCVFEGGKTLYKHGASIKDSVWKNSFPENIIFGCLAETMVLCLEKRFESFSIGKSEITINKMEMINEMAEKNGFVLAPFKWGRYFYDDSQIELTANYFNGNY